MCSTFIHHHQKNDCISSNNILAYSKSQYEAPKQLLQLRSQVEPLIRQDCLTHKLDLSANVGVVSRLSHSQHRSNLKNKNIHLTYIEKDKRVRQMHPQQHQYQAYDRPFPYHSRKMTSGGRNPLMRTPSSGFSSASSSENMLSGLSLNDHDVKINELILDPAAEVDLDFFLLPDARYKQPVQPSTSASRTNLSQISGPSQNGGYMRQIAPSQAKSTMPAPISDYSYSNIKRSSGYIDFMPTSLNANAVSQQFSSAGPLSSGNNARCNYCWKTYVELCQRVANLGPMISCDGPWQWHSLYDAQGRVTCPRLWFAQLDRAGSDMLEQMGHVRNAPV